MASGQELENQLVIAAFARLRPVALGIAVGAVVGLALFVATAKLLLVATGDGPVGPHLSKLGHFLPGYTVSWGGAFLGLGYGALVGFVAGVGLAWLLNLSHTVYVLSVRRSMRRRVMSDGL